MYRFKSEAISRKENKSTGVSSVQGRGDVVLFLNYLPQILYVFFFVLEIKCRKASLSPE